MTGFDLPANFHPDPESLFKKRQKTTHERGSVSGQQDTTSSTGSNSHMAEKTICEFSVPSCHNVPQGPNPEVGNDFELKPGVIHMVQAIPFCGLASEDANNHLQQFLEICSTFTVKGASTDAI